MYMFILKMNSILLTILSYYPRSTELCRDCQVQLSSIYKPHQELYSQKKATLENFTTSFTIFDTNLTTIKNVWSGFMDRLLEGDLDAFVRQDLFEEYTELIETIEMFLYTCQYPPCCYLLIDGYLTTIQRFRSSICSSIKSITTIFDHLIQTEIRMCRGQLLHIDMFEFKVFRSQTTHIYDILFDLRRVLDDYIAFVSDLKNDTILLHTNTILTNVTANTTLQVPYYL
jgi:hypothetical protein